MNGSLGPWATAIDSGASAQLSAFWKKRLAMLPRLHPAIDTISRFRIALLTLTGAAVLALPTLHLARAMASDAGRGELTAGKNEATTRAEPGKPQPTVPGGPVLVQMPGGVTAELIGLADHTAKEKDWWAPDGTPIAAPYKTFRSRAEPVANQIAREIAVEFHVPEGADVTTRWSSMPSCAYAAGTPRDADGQPIRSIHAAGVVMPAGQRTWGITLAVAAGEWNTIAETDGKRYFSRGTNGHTFVFTKALETDDEVVITISHDYVGQDLRIVALDSQGAIITSGGWARGHGRDFAQTTAVFAGRAVADVSKFLLQARPFHRVEIRDMALRANQGTKPTTVDLGTQPPEK